MAIHIGRREFIITLGSMTVVRPLAARAQHATVPVIGFLGPGSAQSDPFRVTPFRQGLSEAGLVEGRNFTIEYRWADGHCDRLPALANELVQRQVAVIAASGTMAAPAAKTATTTIPIVFETSANPIKLGLAASLNRPGGNITGVTQTSEEIAPKRLDYCMRWFQKRVYWRYSSIQLLRNLPSHKYVECLRRPGRLASTYMF
jgi:putative ABC transport system substrate-binding protein